MLMKAAYETAWNYSMLLLWLQNYAKYNDVMKLWNPCQPAQQASSRT